MEFISIPFVACMALTFVFYYARTSRRWQHIVLLAASCAFIGYYHLAYFLTAAAVTIFTFVAGQWIHRWVNTSRATLLLWASIAALVGFWLVARYWFSLFPLGISFYTFQALAYLIEVYWEEDPEEDFWDFSLYMMLFVKFLSGPIPVPCMYSQRNRHIAAGDIAVWPPGAACRRNCAHGRARGRATARCGRR